MSTRPSAIFTLPNPPCTTAVDSARWRPSPASSTGFFSSMLSPAAATVGTAAKGGTIVRPVVSPSVVSGPARCVPMIAASALGPETSPASSATGPTRPGHGAAGVVFGLAVALVLTLGRARTAMEALEIFAHFVSHSAKSAPDQSSNAPHQRRTRRPTRDPSARPGLRASPRPERDSFCGPSDNNLSSNAVRCDERPSRPRENPRTGDDGLVQGGVRCP